MKNTSFLWTMAILLLIFSCNQEPKPIQYGSDGCHFCSMTIVDHQHAAQFVTKKGRHYKFDAIECMINQVHNGDISDDEIANYYVNTYNHPKELIEASKATYIISEELPSPMGANLTATKTLEEAQALQKKHLGTLYTWAQIKELKTLSHDHE